MRFDGRIALVTGAGSGIGRATALAWAERGGHVVVADIDGARAIEVAGTIEAGGGQALAVETDVTDQAAIDHLVATARKAFGRIDVLHNNAYARWMGADAISLIGDLSDEHWRHVMTLGVDAAFRVARAVIPVMLEQGGGAIVNTSSIAAWHAEPYVSAYGIAKAAISQMTRAIAVEYAGRGIRCNAVCPGVIRTPMIEGAPLDADFMKTIPLGRLGEPGEIANVVLFLASDLASYVTGALVTADGGRTI